MPIPYLPFPAIFVLKKEIMQTIKTSITIKASKETVWNILSNFQDYPNWNPFILSIQGELKKGAQLKTTIQPEGDREYQFKPTLLEVEPGVTFRWLGKMGIKGLFDGEHYFILKEKAPNEVELIHGENFRGILVPIIMRMIKEGTMKGFVKMNEALKMKAEASL
jgi:hypothetical protein